MRKLLQLTLLLSCLLILCSHNVNVVGQVDVFNTGETLKENANDTDNQDFEGPLAKTVLFTSLLSLTEKKLFLERYSKKLQLAYSFIRAPPTPTL